MKKIVNIGSKIVHVNMQMLLPEDDMTVSDDVAKLPSIVALAEAGYIRIDKVAAQNGGNQKKGKEKGETPAQSGQTNGEEGQTPAGGEEGQTAGGDKEPEGADK